MKTRITVLSIFLAFIIAGCSSGLEENATLTLFLDFDGNSNSYSASALKNWPPKDDEWNSLRYNIALISISGGRSEISLRPSGSDPSTFTGTAPVGTYTIVVEAYSDNEIYARGSTSTTIKLGRNNAPITMHRAGIYELDIEILPKEIEILQGGSYTFTAIPSYGLEYRDDFANSTNPYKWSVSGSKSTISGSGNSATLFVGLDETASTLTVTVECATNNSTKPGTAKVAVKDLINAQIPVIRFQPNDKDYILGEPATLSVVVNPLTDGGDLTYQWFSSTENKNSGGTAISGETEADYNPDTTTAGTYYYYVEVTNTSSNVNGNKTAMVTSRAAKVTVIVLVDAEKPVITSDPQAG
ncbi:MAG: hypothetical protein FWH53_07185, partial [Leptospirales bacterium]|nr:hypothetical protein [Leptospirales bacterium]